MHGRKRRGKDAPAIPQAELDKKATKLRLYTKLSKAVIALRAATAAGATSASAAGSNGGAKGAEVQSEKQQEKYDGMVMNALKATAKMAVVNPDFYSLWNLRRDLLTEQVQALRVAASADVSESDSCEATSKLHSISQTELALTQAALTKRNPKCYYAWHHRKWVVSLGYVDLSEELELCENFLARDERNFHCWTYRRCVLAALATPASAELAFTDALIARNFSNGSAWHQRTRVLLHERPAREALGVLRSELDKVRQALFTEPDDQSAWMYQRWVLAQILARRSRAMAAVGNPKGAGMENRESNFYGAFMQRLSANGQQDMSATTSVNVAAAASSASDKGQEQTVAVQETVDSDDATLFSRDTLAEIFALEMRTCRELIEVEPSCRWPRLQLLHMIGKLQQASLPLPEGAGGGNERGRLLGELLELDPTHAGYYRDCLRKLKP